jgi:hypothetical protein
MIEPMALRTLAALGSVLILGLAACGGSDDDDDGGDYTLDNVCDKTVPRICSMRESCCTTSGIGYDQAGCEAEARADCESNVALVEVGDASFDGSKVDPCLDGLAPALEACRVGYPDTLKYLSALHACRLAFQGTKDEGAACTRDAECKASADQNTIVGCEPAALGGAMRCKHSRVVGEGASCDFDADAPHLCAEGLYCDLTGTSGTCKTSTALGATCNPLSNECGAGNFCQASSQTCVDALPEGEACGVNPFQCKSLSCTGGTCAAIEPLVNAEECGV